LFIWAVAANGGASVLGPSIVISSRYMAIRSDQISGAS
jgi:hypothetical protein